MDTPAGWDRRTLGAAFLLVSFTIGILLGIPDRVTSIGSTLISILIAWDAYRRSSSDYLHSWLFFLLGLSALGWLRLGPTPLLVAAAVVAAGVAILLATPYRIKDHQPSRRQFLVAVAFAEALALTSSIAGTPVIQAAAAVVPILLMEELFHRRSHSWWKQALPFAILTLILFLALSLRASYALP